MNENTLSLLKTVLPRWLLPFARGTYYRLRSLRFWRNYLGGIAYFVLRRKYYETQGFKYLLPSTDLLIMGKCFRDQHEVNTRAMARRHIPATATVLDLGACAGIVSCVINRKLAHRRAHVAVEANPDVIDLLKTNRDLNDCECVIENCLLSRSSSGEFYVAQDVFISSTVADAGTRVTVPVLTVEDLERKHGLVFDTVFMDIQGSEYDFLRENPDFISRCRMVIVEMHDMIISAEQCKECRRLLQKAGLTMIDSQGRVEVWSRS